MFSSQDESTKDIDMILDSSNCYLFFSDSWDNESYTDEGTELTIILSQTDRDRIVSKYGKDIVKG